MSDTEFERFVKRAALRSAQHLSVIGKEPRRSHHGKEESKEGSEEDHQEEGQEEGREEVIRTL
ncbi:MAG: hypothetical protein KF902_11375 [Phycisphaeraceae bacterium]|nr:hypothetical protein [Phycisphaeraceae bacterium]MBX3361828.1 hypothetical protein [Phycisphaeraceae bacterium]MBX3367522.1 hypothetical protein [Phycisphaeraceae bacterium]QYK47001.1 MAG: hypothetical protein KF838_09410 [Phycisphaeraceae bacterium]